MKIINYCLFSSLLFLFSQCEEEECTPLPGSITVGIYFNLIDNSENVTACEEKYTVEFWKSHCGGGDSNKMNYTYKGCVESDNIWYVQKEGIGSWDITFENKEDQLNYQYIYPSGDYAPSYFYNGEEIYQSTNQGTKNYVITINLY